MIEGSDIGCNQISSFERLKCLLLFMIEKDNFITMNKLTSLFDDTESIDFENDQRFGQI